MLPSRYRKARPVQLRHRDQGLTLRAATSEGRAPLRFTSDRTRSGPPTAANRTLHEGVRRGSLSWEYQCCIMLNAVCGRIFFHELLISEPSSSRVRKHACYC